MSACTKKRTRAHDRIGVVYRPGDKCFCQGDEAWKAKNRKRSMPSMHEMFSINCDWQAAKRDLADLVTLLRVPLWSFFAPKQEYVSSRASRMNS